LHTVGRKGRVQKVDRRMTAEIEGARCCSHVHAA
jgi:hypothetical protein